MSKIEDKIKKIIVEQLDVDKSKLCNESSFSKDLGADSLDIIELIMSIEEEFKVSISDEDAEKITTIKEAIEFIEKVLPKEKK